jgi:RNA polymerase sigma-70 factor (ECF subfamily)
VGEVAGPRAALDIVDGPDLDRHHVFHAVRADLLRRLARTAEAARAYEKAAARTGNAAERAFVLCPPPGALRRPVSRRARCGWLR